MHDGQVLGGGRFLLRERLGEGGMGDVWRAHDDTLGRDVAIKGVNRDPSSVPGNLKFLTQEARVLANLHHERIVAIHDMFVEDGQIYLVMDLISGQDLQEAAESGALSETDKQRILIDVLDALAYLHSEEGPKKVVLHRDLKPQNILLDDRKRALVADFGIAERLTDPNVTRAAQREGTRLYTAPEVLKGSPASKASDVWSFGAVALFLFTGRLYYESGVPEGNFAGPFTDPIEAALSDDPTGRPTASALLATFRRIQQRSGALTAPVTAVAAPTAAIAATSKAASRARRMRWIPVVIAVAALIAIAALAANALNRHTPVAAPPAASASSSAPATTTGTPTPTETATPTETPTPTPTDSAAASATDTLTAPPAGPQWYYLADMQPVDTAIGVNCTGGCTGFLARPDSIGGTMYPQAYVMPLNTDGRQGTATWNAYTKCSTFQATIGLDDKSPSLDAHFLLEREGGATEDLGVLSTGQSKKVTVDLTGVYRFKIVTYLTAATSYDTNPTAVWGDAQMRCSPLPTPQQ